VRRKECRMVVAFVVRVVSSRPVVVVSAVLIPWRLRKHGLDIRGAGGPTLAVIGYLWGYKRGQIRDRKRRKFTEAALMKDIDEESLRRLIGDLPAWVKFPDYDRAAWINNMARNWWPCLSTAICRTVKHRLERLLQAKKPDVFSSIVFETFSMGSVPPRCSGAKVYNTQEEEIILDLEMTWTATNADIVLSVRLAQGTVALPVQLSQVLFQGTVRLIFKPLVPYWPCFGAISVAFVGKPQVDFSLRLIGGELMSVPGLAPALHDLLKNRLLAVMVWPRRVYAPILKHLRKKKTAYDLKPKASGLLRTHLIQARSLRTHGLSAVFATLEIGGMLKRSKVMGSACDIVFEEEGILNFVVQHPDFEALRVTFYEIEAQNPLDAQLMSYEELTAKLREKVEKGEYELDPDVSVRKIGEGIMPVLSAASRKTVDVWLELGEGNGQVHIDFQYVCFSEELGAEVELEMSTPIQSARTLKGGASMGETSSSTKDTSSHRDLYPEESRAAGTNKASGNGHNKKRNKKGKKSRRENGKRSESQQLVDPTKPLNSNGSRVSSAQIGVLYVSLQEARGLVNSDWSGLCSAFVRFVVGSSTYESHVASKSLVPSWKQNFEMIIPDSRECKVIRVEVWDHVSDFIGLFGNSTELVGKADISLKDILALSGPDNTGVAEKEWPIYGQGEDGEIQTGQVSIGFQWMGVPLSPFYVTPSLLPQPTIQPDRVPNPSSPILNAKRTGKRLFFTILRATLGLLVLGIMLILPLRVGAGAWLVSIWAKWMQPYWLVAVVWCRTHLNHGALMVKFTDYDLNMSMVQWVGAEAMLVAAVLLTVKMILWADKNEIVKTIVQPPTRWFSLDRVQREFDERQELLKT